MVEEQDGTKRKDGNGTGAEIDTRLTQWRSGPVRYELIDKDGRMHGPFRGFIELQSYAEWRWPSQDDFEIREVSFDR